ncbi:MAG: class I SAM-dependent methyltransferase [Verrucomicrobiota bacterium]
MNSHPPAGGFPAEREQPAPSLNYRLYPGYGEEDFLPLQDIARFIRQVAAKSSGRLLDFGSGKSPYRELFAGCEYLTADIESGRATDYRVSSDGTVNAPTGAFDIVLSTQVAEHVPNPAIYFSEAYRLLKPGGSFIVTTHGIWEDHHVPGDFQRWTGDGLRRDLALAGFSSIDVVRLTAEGRAICHLLSRHWSTRLYQPGILRKLLRGLWIPLRPWFHRCTDAITREDAMTSGLSPLYIGIAAVARRSG